jgi:penicillin-binding protein 1C
MAIFSKLSVVGIVVVTLLVTPVILNKLYPLDLSRLQDVSKELRTTENQLVYVFQTRDDKWRLKADFHEINPLFLKMLLLKEDHSFWKHGGVSFISLWRAGYQWLLHKKVVSGGSTLTMQVARLLEPRPRTIRTKIIEIFRAYQLERRFSKNQILEIYLTLAPYGGNLEGVRSASWAYFGKGVTHLTPAEASLLAVMPQSPKRWKSRRFSASAQKARDHLLCLAATHHLIDDETLNIALQDPLPSLHIPLPRRLPHLAQRLCTRPSASAVSHCCINLNLQNQIESLAHHSLAAFPPGVNMAILVVYHPRREVLAYLGSADFFNVPRRGQVDFIRAYRSPGSTLKPFIYGFAFEQGMLKPTTYVLDDRLRFGNYLPDNLDKTFRGMITVSDALALSLNIPVVDLLNKIGPKRFLGILDEIGIQPRLPDAHTSPGLSVALGGLGMTLEQLVALYSALAQEGEFSSLKFQKKESLDSTYRLFSALTAAQLTTILSQATIPEFGCGTNRLAIKTGTSYGHRDTWAIGYNAEYTVGIWIGRPDGQPFGTFTGGSLAVPILRQIFKSLPVRLQNITPADMRNIGSDRSPSHREIQVLHKTAPQLLFPVHNTIIEVFDARQPRSVTLSAMGGKRPYTWLIDGIPFSINTWHQKTPWTPQKPGFYSVTLLDFHGQSRSAKIEVQ